jgi:hypothetical protein
MQRHNQLVNDVHSRADVGSDTRGSAGVGA